MGFSWWCEDKDGKDLFEEFGVNSQAMGLTDDGCAQSQSDIRSAWTGVPYKEKLEEAARDAVAAVQSMVAENLRRYTGGLHSDECPTCTCAPRQPKGVFGIDVEQAKRLLSIPLNRVHRAGGGY